MKLFIKYFMKRTVDVKTIVNRAECLATMSALKDYDNYFLKTKSN